jgi:hypothetical protein
MKDAAICVNRCLWSPDGNILGMKKAILNKKYSIWELLPFVVMFLASLQN